MPKARRTAGDPRLAPQGGLPRVVIVAHPIPFNRGARNRVHQCKPEGLGARVFGFECGADGIGWLSPLLELGTIKLRAPSTCDKPVSRWTTRLVPCKIFGPCVTATVPPGAGKS